MPRNFPRIAAAWSLGIPVSYFLVGFLGDFYATFVSIFILTLACHGISSLFVYALLGRAQNAFRHDRLSAFLTAAVYLVMLAILAYMLQMAARFPSLFKPSYFSLSNEQLRSYIPALALTLPFLFQLLRSAGWKKFSEQPLVRSAKRLLPGMALSGLFLFLYLLTSSIFNQPTFDVDDIFFDADGLLWRIRFTTADYRDYYWRAVHPYVLPIIRPLVGVISILLRGDRLAAAILLTALAGAFCVFITWYFVRRITGKNLYALLIAALLGASAAQWVFSSLIETYIFLALIALIFLLLLLKDAPLYALILTGAVSFGITITNFAQAAIAFLFVKRAFWSWVRFGLIVAALTIPLTLLNNLIYPDSQPYFFIPSSFEAEGGNTFHPSIARAAAVARVMGLHSVVAPAPLIFEAEIPFLKVWMSAADPLKLSRYETTGGKALAFLWLGLILLGAVLFLKNLRTADNRFSLALLGILGFNFALHMAYGKDFFLYSANWTYAMILFLALAWKELADQRWFQVILLVFIALLLANNSRLILAMLETSALHIQ